LILVTLTAAFLILERGGPDLTHGRGPDAETGDAPSIAPEDIPETPIILLTTGVEGFPSVVRQGEVISFTIKVYCFKPECEFRPEITMTFWELPPPEDLPVGYVLPTEVNLSMQSHTAGGRLELAVGSGECRIILTISPTPAFNMTEGEVRTLNATLEVGPAALPGRYRIKVIMRGALSKPGTLIDVYEFEVIPGRG